MKPTARPHRKSRRKANTADGGLPTRQAIVEAASRCIIRDGHARLSTRAVALEAGVNQSLIHYHFGTKERLMLAVVERMSRALLERQTRMYDSPQSFAEKWAAACRFYEEDLASGYVRLLTELAALGISNPAIGGEVRKIRAEWRALLTRAAGEALEHFGIRSLTHAQAAAFVETFWIGMDFQLVLGVPDGDGHYRENLRAFEGFLRWLEAERAARRTPALT